MINNLLCAASLGPDPIVLYFHHIGRPVDSHISIAPDEFERALDTISEYGRIVSPHTGETTNTPTFSLTLDDGYGDSIQTALPILETRGISCTLFVNTATVGSRIEVSGVQRSLAAATWGDLASAHAAGHAIGSHGHHHIRWDHLDLETTEIEAETSISLIQDRLGVDPLAFAYPFGRIPDRLPEKIKKYACFATVRVAASHWNCRSNAIRRVYLPARRLHEWRSLLEHWSGPGRAASCEYCCRYPRALG
jgi:peptidoglycan/xylan/chitin deacetylase (PgdA/CDA1 family)